MSSAVHRTCHLAVCVVAVLSVALAVRARAPSDVPGEEISDEQFLDFVYPRDSIAAAVPAKSPLAENWLDRAARSWDAPSLSGQLASDPNVVLMGMGAVFVPRMSSARLEPDVEILTEQGEEAARGKAGRKYSLMPGTYFVMLGSGPHNLRMVKPVTVTENEVKPVLPDWCGLSIDVIDENSIPFRGEYEIARMDDLEPFGRGYGRNEELGEKVKTWVLPPGTYKIFGVGQSFNTMTNFVTVRLIPGEFVRFVLVQNPDELTILGGGAITSEVTTALTSNWRYGVDVGGTVDFNATTDHMNESDRNTTSKTGLSLLSNVRLNYINNPVEWKTRLRLNSGLTFTRDTLYERALLEATPDEMRLSSLFTWRLISWLGPYARAEARTGVLPEYERPRVREQTNHWFIASQDTTRDDAARYDSVRTSIQLQPAFSPLRVEAGLGANANLLNTRYIESRLLGGIGFVQERIWGESSIGDTLYVDTSDATCETCRAYGEVVRYGKPHTIVRRIDDTRTRPELGPEATWYVTLRIGRFATVESEFKIFAPFARIVTPDIIWRATLGWRLVRTISLVYDYEYELRRPQEKSLRNAESKHRVLVRFSYTSR